MGVILNKELGNVYPSSYYKGFITFKIKYSWLQKEKEKCQGVYLSLNDRTTLNMHMYNAHSLYKHKGW